MTLRSREQDRMWHAVQAISRVDNGKIEGYARYAQNLPSMLQGLGLGGTIALLRVKDDGRQLADDLASWLLSDKAHVAWDDQILDSYPATDQRYADPSKRLEGVIAHSDDRGETSIFVYRQAAQEARHYAGWLKRLSKAKDDARKRTATPGATPPPANGAGAAAVAATPANGAP